MSNETTNTETAETTETAFEAHLNSSSLEKAYFEFDLQLEEDFNVESVFRANLAWQQKVMELMAEDKKKSPRDRLKKEADRTSEGIKASLEMFSFIESVFGKDGWYEIVEYYSDKNETGDITLDDVTRLVAVIFAVIYPKVSPDETSNKSQ